MSDFDFEAAILRRIDSVANERKQLAPATSEPGWFEREDFVDMRTHMRLLTVIEIELKGIVALATIHRESIGGEA